MLMQYAGGPMCIGVTGPVSRLTPHHFPHGLPWLCLSRDTQHEPRTPGFHRIVDNSKRVRAQRTLRHTPYTACTIAGRHRERILRSFVLSSSSLFVAASTAAPSHHKSNTIRIFERSSRFAGNHAIPTVVEKEKPGPVFKHICGGVRAATANDKPVGAPCSLRIAIHKSVVDGIGSGKRTIANNDTAIFHERQYVLERHRRWVIAFPGTQEWL